MKEDRAYLLHIQDAVQQIIDYTHEGRSSFLIDRKTQDAVVRNLEIVGEAVKNVTPELKMLHPELPWRAMAGMRDKLIHEYFGVNLELVWEVVEGQLPSVQMALKNIIDRLDG